MGVEATVQLAVDTKRTRWHCPLGTEELYLRRHKKLREDSSSPPPCYCHVYSS